MAISEIADNVEYIELKTPEDIIIARIKECTSYGLEDEAIFLSNEEKTSLKKRLFFSEKSRIILFAGRLVKMKGVRYTDRCI
jgi:hypothetical protein